MPVTYEEAKLLPLTTDDEIESRIADQIGRANSRALWLIFLDEHDVQLPLLIPVDGLPAEPTEEQTDQVVVAIRAVMEEIGASAVIAVLERYGPVSLTARDAAWARSLRAGFDGAGVTLRGLLLSHRSGVRWISLDELAE